MYYCRKCNIIGWDETCIHHHGHSIENVPYIYAPREYSKWVEEVKVYMINSVIDLKAFSATELVALFKLLGLLEGGSNDIL